MKKVLIGIVWILFFVSIAQAQYPVRDDVLRLSLLESHAETIAKWKNQYDQMTAQITSLEKQYEAIHGSRNLGEILNTGYRDYLPSDWQEVYDKVKSGGYEGLTGSGKTIYESNQIFDSCEYLKDPNARSVCIERAVKGAQDKGLAQDAFKNARDRINQIDKLMHKINETQDPKAIAELQARIATEQANIQNEQIKLQMFTMVAAAEDKVQQQRQNEIEARTWARDEGIEPKPVKFNPR